VLITPDHRVGGHHAGDILDAQNQSNAVWVFQIGSTLTTAASSAVTFTNLAANAVANDALFWHVGTTTTFGTNTTFEDNVLGGTTFSFASGATINDGRALTGTGAITVAGNNINFIGANSGYSGGLAFDGGGNVVSAVPEPATNALMRFGINLPSDFGTQLVRAGSLGGAPTNDHDPRVALDRNFSAFAFGAADGRAVARDIFLDGNTFRASRSVNKQPLVADLSSGVGVIAGPWQLTYTQVWRTPEFKTQHGDYNYFGSVSLSRTY